MAAPSYDLTQFASDAVKFFKNASASIAAAMHVEPYAVNQDSSGNFLGNINYAPYAPCN